MLLRLANNQYRDICQIPPPDYDAEKVNAAIQEQEDWFVAQEQGGALRKFKNYLS